MGYPAKVLQSDDCAGSETWYSVSRNEVSQCGEVIDARHIISIIQIFGEELKLFVLSLREYRQLLTE